MSGDAASYLDGNAVAGELREVFVADLTAAIGECCECGRVAALAEARVYAMAPGLVARCAGCESALMRVVKGEGRTWLDLRGLVYLQLSTPAVASERV
jgi:hypothetical protein